MKKTLLPLSGPKAILFFFFAPRGPSWRVGPQLLLLHFFSVAHFLPRAQLCFSLPAGPTGRRSISSSPRPSVNRPSPLVGRPSRSRRAPASLSRCGHVPPLRLTRRARMSGSSFSSRRPRARLCAAGHVRPTHISSHLPCLPRF